ncbi:MAG: CoA transferase [Gammaproteobacteria bacterium]|nr:MAG: CoA transferase [Gammaproteobacteria bacterium]
MLEGNQTGPLDGIKVIDLSRILAGPWASQMLADLGAQVIKVERPIKGDDTRHWGPPFIKEATENQPPQAAYFHCANRNKQSIAIDITTAEGQQLVKDLVLNADVLIENYKVGGLAKYGLDYGQLKAINPKLVYCSITGFGQTGPYANKPGYDAMIQGEGGLMSLTGEPDGSPMKVGVAQVDLMTGIYSCNGILAALLARQSTGLGQFIDVALLDVQVSTLANQGMNYLATGQNPTRRGNGHPNIVPYQTFATQDGSVILAIGNDRQYLKFCELCDRQDLAVDPLYSSNQQRVINRDKLVPIVASIVAQHSTDWWIKQLEQISVPAGPVNTLDEVFNHPQIKHRKMVRKVPDNNEKLIETIASPINLSANPIQYNSAPPDLGEHTKQVLKKDLGLSDQQISQLYDRSIVS